MSKNSLEILKDISAASGDMLYLLNKMFFRKCEKSLESFVRNRKDIITTTFILARDTLDTFKDIRIVSNNWKLKKCMSRPFKSAC